MPTVFAPYWSSGAERRRLLSRHAKAWSELRWVLGDDWPGQSDQRHFESIVPLPPPEEVEAAFDLARAVLSERPPDAVLIASEAGLPLGSLIATHFGLPAPSPMAALLTIDKWQTRRRLHADRVTQPRFALAASAEEVGRFGSEWGWPCLLKARASTMGRLMERVHSPAEVKEAVSRLLAALPASPDIRRLKGLARAGNLDLEVDPAESFLVESVAPGEPIEVDGWIDQRGPHTLGLVRQRLSPHHRPFIEDYELPADLSPSASRAALSAANAAASALDLAPAVYSIELRVHDSTASVIEVNGRPGEDDGFGQLFQTAVGTEPMLVALDLARGITPTPNAREGSFCLSYASSYERGLVSHVPALDPQSELPPGLLEVAACVHVGEELFAASDPQIFPHLAYALAHDPVSSGAARERARAFLSTWRFEIAART